MQLQTITAAALLALAGCATTDPAIRAEVGRTVPVCSTAPQCAAMWDAAQLWIVRNAGFKLQTTTGVVIQTYGPSSATIDSTRVAVLVTKEPFGTGSRFFIEARCGNPFGCTPDIWPLMLDFNRTLGAIK